MENPVVLRPVGPADFGPVGEFLSRHLNPAVPPQAWRAAMQPPWGVTGPNSGFALVADGQVVGAYLALYSERELAGETVPICNLAAFCVLEPFRAHSLRLVRALLGQKGYAFTDLSPSGTVVALNERLGFKRIDTATRLVLNLPRPAGRGVSVTQDAAALSSTLQGRDAQVYADHRDSHAARHLLVTKGDRHGYLVFRRDRRKGLPLFATPLYAGGDRGVLQQAWPAVATHLLVRHRLPVTLAEHRLLGFVPSPGPEWASPRPRMVRGKQPGLAAIDYMYSEMSVVDW